MKIFKRIITDKFWIHPDDQFAAIVLQEKKDILFGRVKNNIAILDTLPDPQSRFYFHDIVKVEKLEEKYIWKDGELNMYVVHGICQPSNIPTFSFEILIPGDGEFYQLISWFKKFGYEIRISNLRTNDNHWILVYCSAESFDQADKILNEFVQLKDSRAVKELKKV